ACRGIPWNFGCIRRSRRGTNRKMASRGDLGSFNPEPAATAHRILCRRRAHEGNNHLLAAVGPSPAGRAAAERWAYGGPRQEAVRRLLSVPVRCRWPRLRLDQPPETVRCRVGGTPERSPPRSPLLGGGRRPGVLCGVEPAQRRRISTAPVPLAA